MQRGWLGRAVENGDPNQYVLWGFLRVLHKHIEIAVAFKNARVDQFVLKSWRVRFEFVLTNWS
jgi:hypothetical protein